MSSTRDLDVAKERLVDSLSTARDATKSAVKDDIAPAVVAAVGAAREASGPAYAEAASRASDAVSALRSSDAAARASDAAKSASGAAKALIASDTAKSLGKRKDKAAKAVANSSKVNKALRRNQKSGRKRWTIAAIFAAAGVAAAAVIKSRAKPIANPPQVDSYPVATPAPSEAPIQAASVDLPTEDPTTDSPLKN